MRPLFWHRFTVVGAQLVTSLTALDGPRRGAEYHSAAAVDKAALERFRRKAEEERARSIFLSSPKAR